MIPVRQMIIKQQPQRQHHNHVLIQVQVQDRLYWLRIFFASVVENFGYHIHNLREHLAIIIHLDQLIIEIMSTVIILLLQKSQLKRTWLYQICPSKYIDVNVTINSISKIFSKYSFSFHSRRSVVWQFYEAPFRNENGGQFLFYKISSKSKYFTIFQNFPGTT